MANEVQRLEITGNPSYGNFMLGFRDVFGAYLPYNPTATKIQGNLEAIPTINPGNVTVTDDTPAGKAFRVEFTNLLGDQDVPLLEANRGDLAPGAEAKITIVTEGSLSGTPVIARFEFQYRTIDTGYTTGFSVGGIAADVAAGMRDGLQTVPTIDEVKMIQVSETHEYA